jgi:thiol-disulfide isomerase/thioredoxin
MIVSPPVTCYLSFMNKSQSFFPALGALLVAIVPVLAGEFPDEWTWDDNPENRASHAALEGMPMPPLAVSGWLNGVVTAPEIKGKVVLLDFYATWCGPCRAAIPHNNELLKKYRDQGLVIIGICTSNLGQENMAALVKSAGIEYPTAQDPTLKSEKAWQVHYYPTYAVVDRKGIVRSIGLQPHNVEKVVAKLLAEPAP